MTPDERWREWAAGAAADLLRRGEGFAISHAPGKGRASMLSVFEATTYGRYVGAYSPNRARSTFRHEVGARAARYAEEIAPMSRYVVTYNGHRVSPVLPDENAANAWLLQHQPFSIEYATRYRGYEIRKLQNVDARDFDILIRRQAGLDGRTGPDVGDFVKMPDETLRRITYIRPWPEGPVYAQLDYPGCGSYYLDEDGHVSYSGGLTPGVPLDALRPTGQRLAGSVWFFHHDRPAPFNGVGTQAFFRVWRSRVDEEQAQ